MMGDQAPRFQGRTTLGLRRNADQFGTYVLGIGFTALVLLQTPMPFWFAYTKPHGIAPAYQQRKGLQRLVPLVGPGWTFGLFIVTVHGFGSIGLTGALATTQAYAEATFLYLTALELLPLPGRDGGRVLASFLSPNAAMKMEDLRQYEGLFIVGVFLIFPGAVNTVSRLLSSLVGA